MVAKNDFISQIVFDLLNKTMKMPQASKVYDFGYFENMFSPFLGLTYVGMGSKVVYTGVTT